MKFLKVLGFLIVISFGAFVLYGWVNDTPNTAGVFIKKVD